MNEKNWFNKHADTALILASVASSIIWMNGKFNDVDKRFNEVDKKFSTIEREVAVVKTVLLMKNILPSELAQGCENNGTK